MELVPLLVTATQFEAEVVVARLRDAGVEAVVFSSDAGGWAPHLALVQGIRVMVPEDALAFARELMADSDGGDPDVSDFADDVDAHPDRPGAGER